MKVIFFFIVVVALVCAWIAMPKDAREKAIKVAGKFWPAFAIATVVTIALLALAFNTNGKVI